VRPAILLLLLSAAVSAQLASIDGVVVNHATGQPLSGVHVRLITGDAFGFDVADRAYGAISDKAGHFSITGVKPGVYTLTLEHVGYLQAHTAVPDTMVALKAGQNIAGQKLEMNPRAIITGRVVDDSGDPVQRVEVTALPVQSEHGLGPPIFSRPSASTDERGEFQILASPGRYCLQASPRMPDNDAPPEIRSDGSLPASYNVTYYPNAAEAGSATVVEAAAGQDVSGIEIHLRRSAPAGPVFNVSGLVVGIPEGVRATVTLQFGESADALYDARSSLTDPDGKFSFSGLHKASYSVFARYSSGKTKLQSQSLDFNLDGEDRTGVQLNLKAGEELAGTLEMAGDKPSDALAQKRTVYLRPAINGFTEGTDIPSAETGKSGAFRLTNIHPGRFRIEIAPFPENTFLQSIALDGAPVSGFILDFSGGVNGSDLKVTLGLGAQILGKVFGPDGELAVSPLTQIMFWKDDKRIPPDGAERVVDAAYSIKALRPGKYRVVAIDILNIGTPDDWDEAYKAFKAAAQEIEVKEGDRIVKDLKVIGKEALPVKTKQ
jgi:hypothetical protein